MAIPYVVANAGGAGVGLERECTPIELLLGLPMLRAVPLPQVDLGLVADGLMYGYA